MTTFIQALIKAHLNKNLTKMQYDILEKIRINYETSPRYETLDSCNNSFGIVIKFKNLIKYAKYDMQSCPWIYDISLDSVEDPIFWDIESLTVRNFSISLICCSNYIVIELDNNRLYEFYELAENISSFLETKIPEDGGYKNNIGNKNFKINICFPEKICKC